MDSGELFMKEKPEYTMLRVLVGKVEHFLGIHLSRSKISMEVDFHIPYFEKVQMWNVESPLTMCPE